MLGYRDHKGENVNASSAAVLASTLLTARFPERFVDFRQLRWKEFADDLGYPYPTIEKPYYGAMLIWAGRFARAIAETETFRVTGPRVNLCGLSQGFAGSRRMCLSLLLPRRWLIATTMRRISRKGRGFFDCIWSVNEM